MTCTCEKPIDCVDPRSCSCLRCAMPFGEEGISCDRTTKEFFDRLESATASPAAFEGFRSLCEARELAGRDTFGLAYLSRDNLSESAEELADFAIYLLLDSLKAVRADGEDTDIDLVLNGALHAFRAYETVCRLAAKRQGSP